MSLLWVKCGDWINHEISSYIERDELFHKNQDVYAHLKVPGTNIEYPIAQHPEDDSYYLSHDFDQNEIRQHFIKSIKITKITPFTKKKGLIVFF